VADLNPTPPFAGLPLPLNHGETRCHALPDGPITAIAPFPGMTDAVARALGGFPAPGQTLDTPAGPLVWAGREMAFLFGRPQDLPDLTSLTGLAAVTDQSGGWAGLRLSGPDAGAVLARLVALDLDRLTPPASARAQLNHLPLLLIHPEPGVHDLWSYRSMAGTLVHELDSAMRGLAARRAIP